MASTIKGVIDLGNSSLKYGIYEDNLLIESGRASSASVEAESLWRKAEIWLISNVSAVKINPPSFVKAMELNANTLLPVQNLYRTPDTLGKDRIAAACGAAALFPNRPVLVIDAGTCITFDYVSKQKMYKGGSISPGIHMRLDALAHFTGRLPRVTFRDLDRFSGVTTEDCILSGVIQGMIGEIYHHVTYYDSLSSQMQVLITGGDASFFENKLNLKIFAAPNLVLDGLNTILSYNLAQS
jgi:type III pantothenate kinase